MTEMGKRWLVFLGVAFVPALLIVAPITSFLVLSLYRAEKNLIVREITFGGCFQRLDDASQLVHDRSGAGEFFSLIRRLRDQSDLILIAGNHDAVIKRRASKFKHFDLELYDSFTTARFEFHHGDCERKQSGRIQIVGHFHPAATLRDGAGLRLKFPALVQETNYWVLPAFSPWAAGTEWEERERSRTWLCTPQRILLLSQEGQDLQDCAGLQKTG